VSNPAAITALCAGVCATAGIGLLIAGTMLWCAHQDALARRARAPKPLRGLMIQPPARWWHRMASYVLDRLT
jgi:hypothetical protein